MVQVFLKIPSLVEYGPAFDFRYPTCEYPQRFAGSMHLNGRDLLPGRRWIKVDLMMHALPKWEV
jgi:hypothetical protein